LRIESARERHFSILNSQFSILLALVLRPIVREKTRTLLTIIGIAVGVGVVVAVQLANQSALRAFRESVDAIAGRANYQIVSDSGRLDENVLFRLQPLWRDGARFAPVIDVEGIVEPTQQPIRLLGVDLLSDLHFRDYRYARIDVAPASSRASAGGDATLMLSLFANDSVILPAPFAREHHLDLGSPITLNILGNRRTLIVRGLLEARGPATAFNGAIAICDIATAQRNFGMKGRLTRVDLLIPEEGWMPSSVQRLLPPATRIERPSRRNERVEKMLRAFRVNLFALAGVALLVGMFLVYNTVLISILRRRRDVGILKTIGTAPRQIFFAFLGEGLLFGLIGAALGIALGDGLARAILGLVGRTINSLYVTSQPEAVALTPSVVVLGLVVGVTLSLLSAVQPSLEAANVRPSIMLRGGQAPPRRRHAGGAAGAPLSFVLAIAASLLPPIAGIPIFGYVAVLFVVSGFSLLAPMIVRGTSAIFAPPMRRAFGIVGHLAAASLPASLRRTSIANAALSLAIAMMVAVTVMVGSFRVTVDIWVRQTVQSDLWLRPSKGLTNADAALFPPSILDDLSKVDFIAGLDPVRGRDVILGDSIVAVGSGDFRVAARLGSLPMITPRSSSDGLRRAIATNGVFVSESFSIKFKKGVGDSIDLPTAHGTRRFPITGVYRDYSNDRGVVVMDRPLYVRSFDDDAINTVVVFLKPGVDRDAARARLEQLLGPKYHAFAILNASIRKEVMTIFDQTFLITYALLAIAIVVAVLGIINTLAALILERTRELALLRVSGMSAREMRTMIVLESALLGIASTVVGVVMGYALSWILIYVINKQSFGWTIAFHTPVQLVAASLAVTFLASLLAGLVPARVASRIDIAAAIKSE
jgi:putative ABC transport system permease protein